MKMTKAQLAAHKELHGIPKDAVTVRTNNVPRPVIDAYELTPKEREEFDYLDWPAIDAGNDSASFIRYKGQLYDLGEFMACAGLPNDGRPNWDGYFSDTMYSGVVVKYVDRGEQVIVGMYYS